MVRNYLTYAGVVGKEKVHSFKMVAEGEIKMTKDSKWGKIKIEQKNFVGENLVRLFYLNMNMFGIPVYALHSYTDNEASMLGKIAGLITVIDARGKEMRISDTITLLNDMCLVAPATLIDSRITWQEIDNTTVKAIFKTEYCTVSANLHFNEKNQLINFTTDERYFAGPNNTFEKVRWSTPFYEYKSMNGIMLLLNDMGMFLPVMWMEWRVEASENCTRLNQTAYFTPHGLGGFLYWVLLYPFHVCIFRGLIKSIARNSVVK
ncbi:MAG: DUF2867 domain-containing protein [Clostridiales bacterium]|nr:DUF2867 domain-containing protein [Clostridiales bacterium]